ncbi:MAG: hypothetical protein NT167_04235 [Verrucomicrobia bacterium]|nr:hypothetical protein [Verrucomicrobiota bacterium]
MSAIEATAEVFVTAFKTLKPRQREAVLTRMLADVELSEDIVDTLALEARRHQPRQSFRQAFTDATGSAKLQRSGRASR